MHASDSRKTEEMEMYVHARDTVPATLTRFAGSEVLHGGSCPGRREALPFNSTRWEFNVQQRHAEIGTVRAKVLQLRRWCMRASVLLFSSVCVCAAGRRYPNGWLSRDRITCLLQSWQAVLPHRDALSAPHTPKGLEATRWMLELPAPAVDSLSAVSSS